MDNVQKNSITDCNTPSSEPFRLHLGLDYFTFWLIVLMMQAVRPYETPVSFYQTLRNAGQFLPDPMKRRPVSTRPYETPVSFYQTLWNAGQFLPDYKARHPRRQPSSRNISFKD
jgi:hypothetical protein